MYTKKKEEKKISHSTKTKATDLTPPRDTRKDKYLSKIIQITWPVLIELILTSLFSMIDMMMLGNIPNTAYAASAVSAVGLSNQPLFLGLAVVQALNVGGTAIIARYYGANQKDRMENVLKHVVIISLLFSLPIAFFGYMNAENILRFMGGQGETIRIGVTYFRIICISYLFQSFNISLTGALRGIGETRAPMFINVRVNLMNVFGNAVLIYGLFRFPQMGIAGAALSTAGANFLASIFLFRYITAGKSELTLNLKKKFKFNRKTIKDLMHIGMPSAAEKFVVRLGVILFVQIVSGLGTVVFAAHQIGMSILSLSFTLGQAFGISSSALVGQSLGKKKSDDAVIYAEKTGRISAIFGIGLGILLFVFADNIMSLYTNDALIIEKGALALRILSAVQPFQAHRFVSAGSLRGAGDTFFPFIASFIGVLLIRVGFAYLFVQVLNLGLVGAWLAIAIDQMIRWVVMGTRFKSGKWKNVVIN